MNDNEKQILLLIPYDTDGTVTSKKLSEMTGLDQRTVLEVINSLRCEHCIPIIGKRTEGSGFSVATTEESKRRGLMPLKKQQESTYQVIVAVENADIEEAIEKKEELIHE